MRRLWHFLVGAAICHVLAWHGRDGSVAAADPPPRDGTTTETPPARSPVGVPRVKLPADGIDAFIRKTGAKYVSVPADEFERLAALAGDWGANKADVGTYLREARLSASLAEDGTLVGRALLDVQHAAPRWRLLPLAPCTLAIHESEAGSGDRYLARWTGKSAGRAALGVGEDGRLGVIVEKSGELEFGWSLRRRRGPSAEKEAAEGDPLVFRLELPPATARILDLELPARWAPRISQGAVEPLPATGAATKRWRVRLSGGPALELSLVSASVGVPKAEVTLRQSSAYRLWPHGIDVQSEFSCDVFGGPLAELEVDLAPGLVLLEANTGAEQRIPWAPSGTAEAPRVRLQFPQPLAGPKQVIRLEATAPLRLDKAIALPAIRPRGVFWQEGVATVWLEKSLSLQGISPRAGRQEAGLSPQSFGRFSGSQLSIRLLTPESGIDVAVARLGGRLEVSQATTVTLGSNELQGRTSAEVTCLAGECFDLWAEVGVLWSVETVETTPAESLADWEPARTVDQRAASLVHIRLAKSLKAGESLRVALAGRHSPAGGARPTILRWDDLHLLTFRDARATQRLWNVEPAPGGTARLGDAAGVRELAAGDLSAAQKGLFTRSPQGLLLAVDVVSPHVEVVTERSRTGLRATLRARALVKADTLREDYRIDCSPNGASLGEVEVRFSQARSAVPEWALVTGDTERPLTAIAIAPAERQTWRVRLPHPTSTPFSLRAVRETPFTDRLAISLPVLPQAESQEGTLSISAEPGARFLVDNRSLDVQDGGDAAAAAPVFGVWQFQGDRHAAPNQEAIAVIPDDGAHGLAGAIIKSARLESYYQPSGGARHRATFQIENHALSAAQLVLGDAKHVEVRWEGTAAPLAPDDNGEITIPLARGRRKLQVEYDAEFGGLGAVTAVEAALPRWQSGGTDLPILEWAWTIISPAGYDVAAGNSGGVSWSQRLLGPLGWRSSAEPLDSEVPPDRPLGAGAGAGEQRRTFWGTSDSLPRALFVHQRTFETAGWAMFLAASLGVYCFGPRSGRRITLVVALLIAAAMLVPGHYVPLALGMLWGFVAGLALTFVASRSRSAAVSQPGEAPQVGSSLVRAGAVGVSGLALIVGHGGPSGQAAEEAPLPLIVPLHADSAAQGTKVVYVPEALWERWRQRQLEAGGEHPGMEQPWMIERADYVGRLAAPATSGAPAPPSLTATYSVRTAASPTRVRLDFGAPLGPFRPLDALLDGQVTGLAWDAAGRVGTLEVPKAGAHALELHLRPSLRPDGASWQLEHPLPPVSGAQANLAFSTADIASAELVSAIGSVTRRGRVLAGELGSADRIVVRWANGAVASQPPRAELHELLWLRVKTGAVSLRGKWVFDVHRGQVRQFHVAADRRLRLNGDFRDGDGQKIRHEGEPLSAPRTAAGPQTFKLTLDPPRSGRFSVEGEFLVEETHGLGRLRYPRVTIGDLPVDRRRLAVSVDADLDYEETAPKGKPRASVSEFLAAWGDRDGQPLLVREGNEVGSDWSLTVRPRELRRAVQQTLWADFGPRRAEVRFQADVTSAAAPCFHHRLLLPADLVVEQVKVSEGSQTREAAWTIAGGALNVFLRDKAAATQRIELSGFVPIPASGAVAVPAIQLDQALTTSAETRIYRQPTVRVNIEPAKVEPAKVEPARAGKKPAPGTTASQSVPTPPESFSGPSAAAEGYPYSRLVGAFSGPPGAALRVNLQPNRPRLRSPVLITTLRKDPEGWLADVAYDLLVSDELDAVTFVAPAGLGEPLAVAPPGRIERQAAGGRTRWRYVPRAALTGPSRVALSWRLPGVTAQRVAVPEIDVVTTLPPARLVALPQALAAGAETWDPEGLTRISSLDEVLLSGRVKEAKDKSLALRWEKLHESLAGLDLYRAPPAGAAAVLHRVTASQGQAQVMAASVEWQLFTETKYHGLARFTLVTDGPEVVTIRLPEGCGLLRCTWAADSSEGKPGGIELPLAAARGDDDAWRISLGPQPTPRTLEVVFAGTLRAPLAGELHPPSPTLVGLPVEETEWTVTLPPGWSAQPADDAPPRLVEGRQVVSLVAGGEEGHPLRLAVRAPATDSLWRRLLVLAALLGGIGGLAWAAARLRQRHGEPSVDRAASEGS